MSAEPAGGSRWTISSPESSKCWIRSNSAIWSLRRACAARVRLLQAGEDLLAVAEARVERVHGRGERVQRALHVGRLGHPFGLAVDLVGGADEGEVELVHLPEHLVVDLHRVEEAGVALVGPAHLRD